MQRYSALLVYIKYRDVFIRVRDKLRCFFFLFSFSLYLNRLNLSNRKFVQPVTLNISKSFFLGIYI